MNKKIQDNIFKTEKARELTLAEAWDILGEYGKYLETNAKKIIDFERNLPYNKGIIANAFFKVLTEENFNRMAKLRNMTTKQILEEIKVCFVDLINFTIPDEEEYKKILETKKLFEKTDELIKETKGGRDLDELDKKINKIF